MESSKAQREENENPKSSSPPPWVELPGDVTANILQRLGAVDVLETAQNVCTHWWRVCKQPSMWQRIDMRNLGDVRRPPQKLGIMCRHAVDRSQGQLVDINIEYFGTDDLLLYIAERSKNLKCLKLTRCNQISGRGIAKAASRFPELEELQVSFRTNLTIKDIENIGTSCPQLKSFTYNTRVSRYVCRDNGSAVAISKSMPNLHHLGLCGADLDNYGLEAILNGCPHLEALDVRGCENVVIRGNLGKRCLEQLKFLGLPFFPYDDFSHDSDSSDGDLFNYGGVSTDDDDDHNPPAYFYDYYGIDPP